MLGELVSDVCNPSHLLLYILTKILNILQSVTLVELSCACVHVMQELAVVYFKASSGNDDGFSQLFVYLQERQRCAVLGSIGASIKDMYIWPLSDNFPLPLVLLPFDGPG